MGCHCLRSRRDPLRKSLGYNPATNLRVRSSRVLPVVEFYIILYIKIPPLVTPYARSLYGTLVTILGPPTTHVELSVQPNQETFLENCIYLSLHPIYNAYSLNTQLSMPLSISL